MSSILMEIRWRHIDNTNNKRLHIPDLNAYIFTASIFSKLHNKTLYFYFDRNSPPYKFFLSSTAAEVISEALEVWSIKQWNTNTYFSFLHIPTRILNCFIRLIYNCCDNGTLWLLNCSILLSIFMVLAPISNSRCGLVISCLLFFGQTRCISILPSFCFSHFSLS